MKFGICLFYAAAPEIIRLARRAEELGFDSFWLGDSHMIFREVYVALGAVAASTKRIEIGPGVTHPEVRHPSVTASAMATLGELAPGRVNLGIGIGSSGPRNIGFKPVGLARLEETIGFIRDLLASREVERDGKRMRLTFAGGAEIPIYVAATSDRTHEMSGRIADGAIMGGPIDGLPSAIAAVRRGERAAGRHAGSVRTVLHTPCSIDDDERAARAVVRGMVARTAMVWLERAERLGTIDPADRESLARLRREYNFYQHLSAEHGRLVEERWIDRFSLTGSAEMVRRRCEQVFAGGVDEIMVVFLGADRRLEMERFADGVMAPLRDQRARGGNN